MKKLFVVLLLVLSGASFAASAIENKEETRKKPPLGTCDESTDYKIYKCQEFKCKMPVISAGNVKRSMEIVGKEGAICFFNYKIEVRHPKFPPADFSFNCKLSPEGALEVANQFTEYKKGNIEIYNNPPYSEVLNKECEIQR